VIVVHRWDNHQITLNLSFHQDGTNMDRTALNRCKSSVCGKDQLSMVGVEGKCYGWLGGVFDSIRACGAAESGQWRSVWRCANNKMNQTTVSCGDYIRLERAIFTLRIGIPASDLCLAKLIASAMVFPSRNIPASGAPGTLFTIKLNSPRSKVIKVTPSTISASLQMRQIMIVDA
jgi:hypothetical protein